MKAVVIAAILLALVLAIGLPVYMAHAFVGCPKLLDAPVTHGMSGPQVVKLQNFLIGEDIDIPAGATGYYGVQTRAAVNAFQLKYFAQILLPLGLSAPTGNVYAATLRQINDIYLFDTCLA